MTGSRRSLLMALGGRTASPLGAAPGASRSHPSAPRAPGRTGTRGGASILWGHSGKRGAAGPQRSPQALHRQLDPNRIFWGTNGGGQAAPGDTRRSRRWHGVGAEPPQAPQAAPRPRSRAQLAGRCAAAKQLQEPCGTTAVPHSGGRPTGPLGVGGPGRGGGYTKPGFCKGISGWIRQHFGVLCSVCVVKARGFLGFGGWQQAARVSTAPVPESSVGWAGVSTRGG